MSETVQGAGWRGKIAYFSLFLSVFAIAWFGIAAIGSRMRLWDPLYGFSTLAVNWGSKLAMAAVAVGLIALIVGAIKAPRTRPVILAAIALLLAGSLLGRLATFRGVAKALPPIHDIQTDWSDPIRFSAAAMEAREADKAKNPVEDAPVIADYAKGMWPDFAGKPVAEVQEASEEDPTASYAEGDRPPYPPIEPVYAQVTPDAAYAIALDLLRSRGWVIISEFPSSGVNAGQIEATDTTGWFGFKDDVAIRIQPTEDGGAKIDMRSTSRVGLSDVGVNAIRVSRFMDDLKRRLAAG